MQLSSRNQVGTSNLPCLLVPDQSLPTWSNLSTNTQPLSPSTQSPSGVPCGVTGMIQRVANCQKPYSHGGSQDTPFNHQLFLFVLVAQQIKWRSMVQVTINNTEIPKRSCRQVETCIFYVMRILHILRYGKKKVHSLPPTAMNVQRKDIEMVTFCDWTADRRSHGKLMQVELCPGVHFGLCGGGGGGESDWSQSCPTWGAPSPTPSTTHSHRSVRGWSATGCSTQRGWRRDIAVWPSFLQLCDSTPNNTPSEWQHQPD